MPDVFNATTKALQRIPVIAASLPLITIVLHTSNASAHRESRWFSAWTASHNVGEVVPALGNTTVRLIARPTISGQAVRIKLENTRAQTPTIFSAAFIGRSGAGAAVVAGTNAKLTFGGAPGLTLAPGQGAWSDPVAFQVKAFQRLTVSVNVSSASDVSMHTLGLVTTYVATGSRAAETAGNGFTPIPGVAPGNTVWVSSSTSVSSRKRVGEIADATEQRYIAQEPPNKLRILVPRKPRQNPWLD